jgi:hypothetical protein
MQAAFSVVGGEWLGATDSSTLRELKIFEREHGVGTEYIVRALAEEFADDGTLELVDRQTLKALEARQKAEKELDKPSGGQEELREGIARLLHEHGVYSEDFEAALADMYLRHGEPRAQADPEVEQRVHDYLHRVAESDEAQKVRREVRAHLHRQTKALADNPPQTREPIDELIKQARSFMPPLDRDDPAYMDAYVEAEVVATFIGRLEVMAKCIEAGDRVGTKEAGEQAVQGLVAA